MTDFLRQMIPDANPSWVDGLPYCWGACPNYQSVPDSKGWQCLLMRGSKLWIQSSFCMPVIQHACRTYCLDRLADDISAVLHKETS